MSEEIQVDAKLLKQLIEMVSPIQEPRILYSRKEAAKLLSISIRHLDYLIIRGLLQPTRVGRSVRLHRKTLEAFAKKDRPVL